MNTALTQLRECSNNNWMMLQLRWNHSNVKMVITITKECLCDNLTLTVFIKVSTTDIRDTSGSRY